MMMVDDGEILMYFIVFHCIEMTIGNMREPNRDCCPVVQDFFFYLYLRVYFLYLHLHLYFFVFHRNDRRGYAVAKR